MSNPKSEKRQPVGPAAALVHVSLKLAPEDRDDLQREALRLRIAGRTSRIDMSAVVRGLIAEWRANRAGATR